MSTSKQENRSFKLNHSKDERTSASPEHMRSLISSLTSRNGMQRQHTREALVEIGGPAVPDLIEALTHSNRRMRWEAAKALGEIGDATAAPALASTLNDDDDSVRWAAAKGLVAMERHGLRSLFRALANGSNSSVSRNSAHYVCRTLECLDTNDAVSCVLEALEGIVPDLEVPVAAQAALGRLTP